MKRYVVDGETVKDTYIDRVYGLDDLEFLLNRLYRESMITQRDMEHAIELKAVNRHLKMENRILLLKLQQLTWKGMLDVKEIEDEVSTLCENPDKLSGYIHSFEKENFELKEKLKELGNYDGDILR